MLQPPLCAGSARHVAGAAGPATQWCSMTEETVPMIVNRKVSLPAGHRLRNFDVFDVALNHVS